jgi:hypothetical protein
MLAETGVKPLLVLIQGGVRNQEPAAFFFFLPALYLSDRLRQQRLELADPNERQR